MTVEIVIHGPVSVLKGDYPVREVKLATSFPVDGAQYSPSFRKGLWDGRKHLLNRTSGSFPTGLVDIVKETCEGLGFPVTITDLRTPSPPKGGTFDLHGSAMTGKFAYQLDACKEMIDKKQGIVKIATGGGKCLAPNTLIRLYDGSTKEAKDVQVGDLLMGPDSRPRTVLTTCRGVGPMYKITQNVGASYVCNDVHVLTLQHTKTGSIIDIPLNEYLTTSKTFKHCWKHYSTAVEYQKSSTSVDPYFFGLWLGDGSKTCGTPQITTNDQEIHEYLKQFFEPQGFSIQNVGSPDRCPTYSITTPRGQTNPLATALKEAVANIKQFIINDQETRLRFLAGLIDSDGHKSIDKNSCYELTLKEKSWVDDVYFLVRSLGYRASPPKPKCVKLSTGEVATYYRLHFTVTKNAPTPPVILPRKKACNSSLSTRTGFEVQYQGLGDYAGFTLDGDGRFLLADYTVTHNTNIAAAVIKYLGLKSLFIVTNRELLYQSRDRFKRVLQVDDDAVGIVGDGHWNPGSWITVATVDTLESRINEQYCQDLIKETEVLFIDEAHHVGSDTWYTVSILCPAMYRYGLSGTPLDRTDGANLRLIAATGSVIVDIPTKTLVDLKILAKADIVFDSITEPIQPKKSQYATVYKKAVVENPQLLQKVLDWTIAFHDEGLQTLILVEEIAQGKLIDDLLWTNAEGRFLSHVFIHGSETTEVRQQALKDFADRKLPILIASTILDEGVDVPTIDTMILAGSRKSKIRTVQRLGRGLRGDCLIVVEFANYCHKYLIEHSMKRLEDYRGEQCFGIHKGTADRTLIRKLWDRQVRNRSV